MLLGMEGRREELGGTVSGDGALCHGRVGEERIEGRTIWRFRVRPSGRGQSYPARGAAGWPARGHPDHGRTRCVHLARGEQEVEEGYGGGLGRFL